MNKSIECTSRMSVWCFSMFVSSNLYLQCSGGFTEGRASIPQLAGIKRYRRNYKQWYWNLQQNAPFQTKKVQTFTKNICYVYVKIPRTSWTTFVAKVSWGGHPNLPCLKVQDHSPNRHSTKNTPSTDHMQNMLLFQINILTNNLIFNNYPIAIRITF